MSDKKNGSNESSSWPIGTGVGAALNGLDLNMNQLDEEGDEGDDDEFTRANILRRAEANRRRQEAVRNQFGEAAIAQREAASTAKQRERSAARDKAIQGTPVEAAAPVTEQSDVVTSSPAPDEVNHPPHYRAGGLEVIDVIEAFGLGFHEGNVLKYLLRWRRKGGVQDLQKAAWYLQRLTLRAEAGDV